MRQLGARALGLVVALSAAGLASSPAPALAAPPTGGSSPADAATAQGLYDAARGLMAHGRYAEACPKLEESVRLDNGLGAQFHLAECYEKLGKTATAWAGYLQVASLAKAAGQKEREQVARSRATALEAKVPRLVITVSAGVRPGDFEVRRDGSVVTPPQWDTPLPVDPGTHVVSAKAGGKSWETTVTLGTTNETAKVNVPALKAEETEALAGTAPATGSPVPASGAAPDQEPASREAEAGAQPGEAAAHDRGSRGGTQRAVGAVIAAFGIAGVAVGSFFGVKAISANKDATAICPSGGACTRAGADAWSSAVTDGNVSTIAFVAGGALVVTGVVVFLTAPRDKAGAEITIGPRRVALEARF